MANAPTPYQSYLGLGSLIDIYSEDWLADDSESEEVCEESFTTPMLAYQLHSFLVRNTHLRLCATQIHLVCLWMF